MQRRFLSKAVAPGGTQVVPPGASRTAAEKYHPPRACWLPLLCRFRAKVFLSTLGFAQVLRGRCRLLALAVLDRSAVCAVLSYSCYGIVYLSGSCVFRAAPLLKLKVCSSSGRVGSRRPGAPGKLPSSPWKGWKAGLRAVSRALVGIQSDHFVDFRGFITSRTSRKYTYSILHI